MSCGANALQRVCHDANVPLVHVVMRMSAWEYAYDVNAPL